MTAAEGGPKTIVAGVFLGSEAQDMYLDGPGNVRIWTDSNRNFTLRQYGRLEYGSPEVGWLVASVKRTRPSSRTPRRRPKLRVRLRYFLNSFRGFAAFDVRGHDDSDRA